MSSSALRQAGDCDQPECHVQMRGSRLARLRYRVWFLCAYGRPSRLWRRVVKWADGWEWREMYDGKGSRVGIKMKVIKKKDIKK